MSESGDPGQSDEQARQRDASLDKASALIYCGLCGALNPATNYYCAACGSTLVDAFHAAEGIRVFERPDPAARMIDILPAGTDLDIVEENRDLEGYVRVRIGTGRLGYVRLRDTDAKPETTPLPAILPEPDINTHARGCVSTSAALAALVLLVVLALLGLVIILTARPTDAGLLWLLYCVTIVPLLVLTAGLYVGAKSREDRINDEVEEALAEARRANPPDA